MSLFESVITRKGQITLPAELRRRFNLQEGDRVAFDVDEDSDGRIIVRPVQPVHERTYGVAAKQAEPIDLDRARRLFAESRAHAYVNLEGEQPPDPASS